MQLLGCGSSLPFVESLLLPLEASLSGLLSGHVHLSFIGVLVTRLWNHVHDSRSFLPVTSRFIHHVIAFGRNNWRLYTRHEASKSFSLFLRFHVSDGHCISRNGLTIKLSFCIIYGMNSAYLSNT